jgi:hypothetical protein
MSEKSIADKLLIKPRYSVLFVNAPRDYFAMLGELGSDVADINRDSIAAYANTIGLKHSP